MNTLQAGAGRAAVRFPDDVWEIDGFTREHDPLFARVLLLDGDTRVAWAVLDQTSLQPEPLQQVRAHIARIAAVPEEAVIVSVSHTFSAPHLSDPARVPTGDAQRMRRALDALLVAVDAATEQAVGALRSATIGARAGVCDVNVNRDVEVDDGWTLGFGEQGYSDKTLLVVRVDDADGAPLAVLLHYAVQPSIMNESVGTGVGKAVTADLAGAAVRRMEEAFPGVVAMFIIGAAGDQAPALTAVRAGGGGDSPASTRDAGEAGFVVVDLLGERLGNAAVALAAETRTLSGAVGISLIAAEVMLPGQQPTPRDQISPRRAHAYLATAPQPTPYWILRVGDYAVVGVQVELSATTGRRIRDASPFGHTAVATMVNGGAKYLPEAGAFDRFTYEALSSRYARGGAETLAEHVAARLSALYASPTAQRSTL